MTLELASLLRVFNTKEKWPAFCEGIDSKCIHPAMQLYEKMAVSTHHFYLDVNPFMAWGRDNRIMSSNEFVDSLDNLDCRNMLQNRKAFNVAKLDPQPSLKELHHHLENICTVRPALYMRQIGQRDAIKEPSVVRKQQMLVAWGPDEKRKKFMENGERPIVSHLYFAKTDKAEGWGPSLRWL